MTEESKMARLEIGNSGKDGGGMFCRELTWKNGLIGSTPVILEMSKSQRGKVGLQ